MNKRIKKKVMKRAIQKYDNKEILSAKEIKMITPYIFIDIFDFDLFRKKVSELMNAFAKAFAQALQTVSEYVANFAESLEVKEVEELEAEL